MSNIFEITRFVGQNIKAAQAEIERMGTSPLLVLHYLEYESRAPLGQVYPAVDYRRTKVALVTLKDVHDTAIFRDFLHSGASLRIDTWMTKEVKPLVFEFYDEKRRETNFWISFAYLAIGTILARQNIAIMDDAEIKLWEQAAGEAMTNGLGVTVVTR